MLLNMTFGQKPFEVYTIHHSMESRLWCLFSPTLYIQAGDSCYGRYEIELLIRDSIRVYFWGRRTVCLYSTKVEEPLTSNLITWEFKGLPPSAQWNMTVWDMERFCFYERFGSFALDRWAVIFSEIGAGYTAERLTPSQMIIYLLPEGTYLGQAAVYRRESALPGLRQYLSVEERRFTLRTQAKWDTLRLSWHIEELRFRDYLLGLYLYQGESLRYQAFSPERAL